MVLNVYWKEGEGALRNIAIQLFVFFSHFGGPGLLVLGILDSSFLFTPLGNDLLVIAMSAHKPHLMLYYALMSAIGSVGGALLIDLVCRKGGEEALERYIPQKRLQYLRCKMEKNAGWAVAFACVAPPPFPFTVTIVAASALQYSRKKMLLLVLIFRMIRFTAEGVLAVIFGKRILHWADSDIVHWLMVGMVVVCVIGSVVSVVGWIRKSRRVAQPATS